MDNPKSVNIRHHHLRNQHHLANIFNSKAKIDRDTAVTLNQNSKEYRLIRSLSRSQKVLLGAGFLWLLTTSLLTRWTEDPLPVRTDTRCEAQEKKYL